MSSAFLRNSSRREAVTSDEMINLQRIEHFVTKQIKINIKLQ